MDSRDRPGKSRRWRKPGLGLHEISGLNIWTAKYLVADAAAAQGSNILNRWVLMATNIDGCLGCLGCLATNAAIGTQSAYPSKQECRYAFPHYQEIEGEEFDSCALSRLGIDALKHPAKRSEE
ncbi:hypothetical protein PZ897_12830 [Hoeflea sp. YIM 152468]|uniref:hypothetical protein n=1 Tax=Hoeflea sp. YIM 152468 TaxID=3031759 RepID=UPI0023DA8412|nr:hypothetical protein [Hoeflea sp. YIM 152468]MDF1609063.1 hypothetical protein [Hoeflea sp. YIM 152468]